MAIDAFLELIRMDGSKVEGESLDTHFPKAMEIKQFSMGADPELTELIRSQEETVIAGGGDEAGKDMRKRMLQLTFRPNKPESGNDEPGTVESFAFVIRKQVDTASPELFINYCHTTANEITPYKTARVSLRIAGSEENIVLLVAEFGKAYVSKYSLQPAEEEFATEDLEFVCYSFSVAYSPQAETGHRSKQKPQPSTWDFENPTGGGRG